MALAWTKNLATGIDWQDKQHIELFDRVNKLLEAMMSGKGKAELLNVVKFLDTYVISHFGAEDQVMNNLLFHERLFHIGEHNKFKERLQAIKGEIERGIAPDTVIMVKKELTEWLSNHIGKIDKRLGAFIIAKGNAAGETA